MWWRNDIAWDPFLEMRRLQRDMNRLFAGQESAREPFPAINAWGDDNELTLTAELPGVDPDEIEITVMGDQFQLRGKRKADDVADDVVCHRCERGVGEFSRSFRLPYEVSSDKVAAKCRNGILTITLPRAEVTKPRKIEVKAG